MSLTVTLDYVPSDGPWDPLEGIRMLVQGADITGIDSDNLASNLAFIRSATDRAEDPHGRLWFKRGEGQLYLFRDPQFPSGTAQPVGVGPRIEILGVAKGNLFQGQPAFMSDSIATGMRAYDRLVGAPLSHYAPIVDGTPLASGTTVTGKWAFRWTQMAQFIPGSTMSDTDWAPLILHGECQVYCGSGMSYTAGVPMYNRYPAVICQDFTYTDPTGSNYNRFLGFALEAKTSTDIRHFDYVFRQFSPRFIRNN